MDYFNKNENHCIIPAWLFDQRKFNYSIIINFRARPKIYKKTLKTRNIYK